jgi:hypothetical protein
VEPRKVSLDPRARIELASDNDVGEALERGDLVHRNPGVNSADDLIRHLGELVEEGSYSR